METRSSQLNRPEAGSMEQRGSHRMVVRVSRATTRREGENARDAAVHDLSIYGCRMTLSGDQQAGDRLWIRLDGGRPVAATIVWYDDGLAGCRFDHPIDRSLMRRLTTGAF